MSAVEFGEIPPILLGDRKSESLYILDIVTWFVHTSLCKGCLHFLDGVFEVQHKMVGFKNTQYESNALQILFRA